MFQSADMMFEEAAVFEMSLLICFSDMLSGGHPHTVIVMYSLDSNVFISFFGFKMINKSQRMYT